MDQDGGHVAVETWQARLRLLTSHKTGFSGLKGVDLHKRDMGQKQPVYRGSESTIFVGWK